jgi:hypothetical protein
MNAPLHPDAFRREAEDVIHSAAGSHAQRWEWRHQFGTMVIEVRGGEVFVDGARVAQLGFDAGDGARQAPKSG